MMADGVPLGMATSAFSLAVPAIYGRLPFGVGLLAPFKSNGRLFGSSS